MPDSALGLNKISKRSNGEGDSNWEAFGDMTCPQLNAGIKLDLFSLQQD